MLEKVRNRFKKPEILSPDHRKRSTDLENEIQQCLSYFENIQREAHEKRAHEKKKEVDTRFSTLKSIHGRQFTVGRLKDGYFWQGQDNIPHVIGTEKLSQEKSQEIIQEIQTITFSYQEYLAVKKNQP